MNKAQLINTVASKCALSKKDADAVVNSCFDTIIEELEKGEKVQIVGFGCFDVRQRSARKGRNPMTGEIIDIGETRSVAFKPGKLIKEAMNRK